MNSIKSAPTENEPRRERVFILNETILRTSPTLACEIGLNESMILLQLDFWISITNNFYDGRYWTYQSTRDMREKAFPFWSLDTINRTINKLISQKYILEGNYNKHRYDKTRWFALNTDRLLELQSIAIKKAEIQSGIDATQNRTRSTQNRTGSTQNRTTIPEITTEITTEITEFFPIISDINNTEGPFADFSKKQKNHDIERKIKFSTFRKQLKGDKLQAFELVADNLEKVIGKTLLEFVEQSLEAVRSAYEEMVQRDKKHFSYFTKVFFSHLTKQKSPQMRKPARKEMSVEEEADMLAFLEKEDMLTDDILSIYSEKGKELYYAKRNGNGN